MSRDWYTSDFSPRAFEAVDGERASIRKFPYAIVLTGIQWYEPQARLAVAGAGRRKALSLRPQDCPSLRKLV